MWGVSVRTSRKSHMLIRKSFTEAKTLALKAREKYKDYPDVIVELISRRKPFPPPKDFTPSRNRLWCPYCGKERLFYLDKEFSGTGKENKIWRCPVCGITKHAYWVMTYNKLWPSIADHRKAGKK